ncbi:MAG: RNA methyltransferase [Chloroflexota bacterium]|nr:RNA methyltransferase [Chloroflexota bacterium]
MNQRKHRQRQGRFSVEGVALLEMALAAGVQPQEVYFSEEQLQLSDGGGRVLARLAATDAELVAVSLEVMNSLADRGIPEGIVSLFPLFETPLNDLRLAGDGLVLLIDRLQDPGNLGTLIRTADAIDAAAVVLIEPCVDPFESKAVRATMGSLFNVPLMRTTDVPALFQRLAALGLSTVAADAHRGEAWGANLWQGSVALVVGHETRGLTEDVLPYVDAWVSLPMVGKAESLNVAVAGGVLMYAWLKANERHG